MGGNRSGKTEIVIVGWCFQLLSLLPARPLAPREEGWRFYLCSQNKDKQREVVQEKLKLYLPDSIIPKKPNGEWMIHSTRDTYDYMEFIDPRLQKGQGKGRATKKFNLNGARLYFRTYDSGLTAFEGGSIDAAIFDEEPTTKSIYEAVLARLLDRKRVGSGWLTAAMTPDPDKGFTWTFDEIVDKDGQDPDRLLINMTTYDNKINLGEQEVKKLESTYDEATRKARIYGLHVAREGFVLPDFKPVSFPNGNLIDPFSPDWSLFTPYESTDWGFKHPWHWGFYAVSKENEIFKYAEIHLPRLKVTEMKRLVYFMRKKYGYKIPYQCFGDPSMGRVESSALSVFNQLAIGLDPEDDELFQQYPDQLVWIGEDDPPEDRKNPLYIRWGVSILPANNDRDTGWMLLNGRMRFEPDVGRPNWFYTKNCVASIKEAKNLTWPPENDTRIHKAREIARKRNDDAPDSDRYLSNANPIYVGDFDCMLDYNEEPTRSRFTEYYEEGSLDAITGW